MYKSCYQTHHRWQSCLSAGQHTDALYAQFNFHSQLHFSLAMDSNSPQVNPTDYYYNRFTALCPGLPGWAGTRRNIHPLTPILIINQPLSASSTYYDSQHPSCSIYVLDILFAQPFSKSSLVYFLVWHLPLHIPYISSPNHCLLFAAHARTIATCLL